jgi:hypothetical protein
MVLIYLQIKLMEIIRLRRDEISSSYCDIAQSSLVDDRGFRGAFCLHHQDISVSETSVSIYQTTRCNIPEDSHLQIANRFVPSVLTLRHFPKQCVGTLHFTKTACLRNRSISRFRRERHYYLHPHASINVASNQNLIKHLEPLCTGQKFSS